MIDPARLREGGSEGSPELTELFRDAKKPEPLTPATDARLLARITALSTAPAAPPVKGWLVAGGAVALAVAAALVVQRAPTPNAASSPPPTHSASPTIAIEAAPGVDAAPPAAAPEPESLRESKHAPAARASQVAPAPAASSSEDALAGEARLLNQAHAAMATDPRKALALASEHAKLYPHGQLAAERELILIQALVKLGRSREAEARGHALRKSAPSSIYGERLDAILKEK